ncbi:MAG: aminotransferase class I/II-fold pyridoxal phosphate-dependent enzyme [Thermoplasmataceae archaeon]
MTCAQFRASMRGEKPVSADHGGSIISLAARYGKSPEEYIDFSSSVNEFIDTGKIQDEFNLNNDDIGRYYPENDLTDIEEKFAGFNGVYGKNITLGAGLTPLIYRSLGVWDFSRAVVLYPAFSEYERAIRSRRMGITPIPSCIVRHNPDVLLSYSYDFLFIANPDNPTGTLTDKETIGKIAKISLKKNAVVFMDEAFMDFCDNDNSSSKMIHSYPNLIVGRTLTKITGFPGIRVGYTISSTGMAEKLKSGMESWPLSQQAINFARKLDMSYLKESIKDLGAEREYMKQRLESMGLKIIGTPAANYISFRCTRKRDDESLPEFLAGRNVIIRELKKYRGLDDLSFRVSIKRREKNKILLDALEEYMVH